MSAEFHNYGTKRPLRPWTSGSLGGHSVPPVPPSLPWDHPPSLRSPDVPVRLAGTSPSSRHPGSGMVRCPLGRGSHSRCGEGWRVPRLRATPTCLQGYRDAGRSGGFRAAASGAKWRQGCRELCGSAGEETMDGRRAVAERKYPASPESSSLRRIMGLAQDTLPLPPRFEPRVSR